MHIKQYHTVTYLGCSLDENLSESFSRLRFLHKKTGFCLRTFRRRLCKPQMQTNFVCACSACHPNLNKGLKPKLQIVRNKYKQCCLNLNNRAHIDQNKFEEINYSPGNDRFEQLVSSISFKI